MLVRQPFRPMDDEPEIIEKVNCRCCGAFEKPWVWWSCKRCGITGAVRREIVRRFLEEQAKGETK